MGESLTEPAELPASEKEIVPPGSDELEEVRRVLVGPEQRQIQQIVARLEDRPANTRELSRILPDALSLRANDAQLTRALAPSVEEAITASVRRNPKPLADALFPVMGPAIRKAIAHTLSAMMESLNRTVDQSVSWRSLRWRATAWRTGKPFAEIVLLNTLVYRIEQVFLIHRESGLLLQHVALPDAPAQDADMVSAMLTAIGDFVRDSFGAGREETLDAFRVGETLVVVEQGPHAVLAAVVRGTPPPDIRVRLKEALESIHLQRGEELEAFLGDSTPFDALRPVLQDCLHTQFRTEEHKRAFAWRRWAVLTGVVLAALAIWLGMRWREQRRFDDYLARLRAEPGIVVIESGRRNGRFFVSGLRDPLAESPSSARELAGLAPGTVEERWEAYSSHAREFTLARARAILRWPPSVSVELNEGMLVARGNADSGWIVEAERLAALVPGVLRVDVSGVTDESLQKMEALVESTTVVFPKGSARVAVGQNAVLDQMRAWLLHLNGTATAARSRVLLEIVGHADTDGTEQQNTSLSLARAEAVREALGLVVLNNIDVITRGVGTDDPVTPGNTELEKQQNRRVSFRVDIGAPAAAHAHGGVSGSRP